MNSYTRYGIYAAGRTIETLKNGFDAFETSYICLEKTIMSNLISPLSYAVKIGMEYAAWNANSKAVALPLKDLADALEAIGGEGELF